MLEVIQVGHDPASDSYVKRILKNVQTNGMNARIIDFDESVTQDELNGQVIFTDADAIMIMLPLPSHINKDWLFKCIPPEKDIDGLNPVSDYYPLTPSGIMRWFHEKNINLEDKIVTVLGRSDAVGKPIVNMLIEAGAATVCCNSHTNKFKAQYLCRSSDIVISAIGKRDAIDALYISDNHRQIWVDVGINLDSNGRIVGDLSAEAKVKIDLQGGEYTPVPGGVGKWTNRELVLRLKEMEKGNAAD